MKQEFETKFKILNTNLLSFERDYDNVDNFYRYIQIGTRISDKKELIKECNKFVDENQQRFTPDLGGLLCVLGYNDKNLRQDWIELVDDFLAIESSNPHFVRWQISLSYLAGKLYNNKTYYTKCLNYDFSKFNTLILTKQLLACIELSKMNSKKDEIRSILNKGLNLYKKGLSCDMNKVIGINDCWLYFGCAEIAELSDIASQLVIFYENIDLFFEDKKAFEKKLDWKRFGLLNYCRALEERLNNG
jgi:hypothetical protein